MGVIVKRYGDPKRSEPLRVIVTDRFDNARRFITGNGGQLDILNNDGQPIKAYGAGVWIDVEVTN